jgi:hypothetical protein
MFIEKIHCVLVDKDGEEIEWRHVEDYVDMPASVVSIKKVASREGEPGAMGLLVTFQASSDIGITYRY